MYPTSGTPMLSSNSPNIPATWLAWLRPMTWADTSIAASTVTGFVFPGIMLLPGTSSWVGISISARPVKGPENMSLRSWQSR